MQKVKIKSKCKRMLADLYTPVSIYLRVRDKYPGSVLLESADNNAGRNSFSFIAIHPIAGMEINKDRLEYKYPGQKEVEEPLDENRDITEQLMGFIRNFEMEGEIPVSAAQNFFGYTAYDAIQFFDYAGLKKEDFKNREIPLLRYRLYQYVIAIDHFKDELFLCENLADGIKSEFEEIETLIRIKDCPTFPFHISGKNSSNLTDDTYREMVSKGITHCQEGSLAQIVLSRSFNQSFTGDEFNVYRALRSINPSPYLFYFDYGDYKIMGSSPESQLIVRNNQVILHPIAGTIKRTGNEAKDKEAVEKLLKDPKENMEHIMLVDLAQKELKQFAEEVHVSEDRAVHFYSHVIHLVSEVVGTLPENANPFKVLTADFPAGTLTGDPKTKAMKLINEYESIDRGFYGGCIGLVGVNGDFNHAIMIRSFLSKGNTLRYQAGAGVVALSKPENELQEVNNKLRALNKALELAETL